MSLSKVGNIQWKRLPDGGLALVIENDQESINRAIKVFGDRWPSVTNSSSSAAKGTLSSRLTYHLPAQSREEAEALLEAWAVVEALAGKK